jgi:hypothetical protein
MYYSVFLNKRDRGAFVLDISAACVEGENDYVTTKIPQTNKNET